MKKVSGGSPAEEAGILARDSIVWCNGIRNDGKSDKFQELLDTIKRHKNRRLGMYVLRPSGVFAHVIVEPRKWNPNNEGLTGMMITK